MKNKTFVVNKIKSRAKRGFTLVEILVAITIFIMIVIVVTSIYNLSQETYKANANMTEISQNGRIALDRMTRELRQAKGITTSLSDDRSDATSSIEFEDGHTPFSSYQDLNSEHFYIRYYLKKSEEEINELHRQYLVYCFDPCDECDQYYRWNKTQESSPTTTHACILEDKVVAEHVSNLEIWNSPLINIALNLKKDDQTINIKTRVTGRNI
ncbi:MAG: PilW family protein [Minisyncoccales bacterium]